MGILSRLFDNLFSDNKTNTSAASSATHPCSNCPSDCAIAGEACGVCAPYKRKLIDLIYYVDHLEEYMAQYEVVGLSGVSAAITCPHCGALTTDHFVCEYCGSKLSEDSSKIRVASASEIPNPIMQAQDIIFDRYETVIKQYSKLGGSEAGGILDDLISAFTGDNNDSADNKLGAKMSEAEIKEAAALYNTTVGEYLTGLDNGRYLTLAGRKAVQSYDSSGDYVNYTPSGFGFSGIAGLDLVTRLLLNNRRYHRRPGVSVFRSPAPRPIIIERPPVHRPYIPPRPAAPRPAAPRPAEKRPSAPRQSVQTPAQPRPSASRPTSAPRPVAPSSSSQRPSAQRPAGHQPSFDNRVSKQSTPKNRPTSSPRQEKPVSQEPRRINKNGWKTGGGPQFGSRTGTYRGTGSGPKGRR